MEAFILIHMDYHQRDHNNITWFNRTHCGHSIPVPGSNCLFRRIRIEFIQYGDIIYNCGKLRDADGFIFFKHYDDKCYS